MTSSSNQALRNRVIRIPVAKIPESLQECFYSALNFWQGGCYAQEKGGLHIAVGLWILAIEEVGKYVLLQESATKEDSKGMFEVSERDFKNHNLKSGKALTAFKEWGLDLQQVGIPLTNETRAGLWFVAWDDKTQVFRRAFAKLEPYPITRVRDLGELVRLGLDKMKQLLRISSASRY